MEVDPSYCQTRVLVWLLWRKAISGVQGRIPLHAKNWCVRLADVGT